MKKPIFLVIICLCLLAFRAAATTYYVDINNANPTPPYTSWSTAATNIQDAVNQTVNGDLVLVNPGVYQSGGYTAPDGSLTAVVVTNVVTIQGVNGQAATWISGSNVMRCIYLGSGTALAGFTLTNGIAGNGGGVFCASTNASISNCLITSNSVSGAGGGVYQGSLTNCIIICNSAYYGGAAYNSIINNSLLASNQATYGGAVDEGLLNDCVVESNTAVEWAGGVYVATLNDCLIINNSSGNLAGGELSSTLNNCTLSGNSAATGGGAAQGTLNNCIIYYNNAPSGPNFSTEGIPSISLDYSCTTPLPGGPGNITNAPLFVNVTNDFHLLPNSPCINSGNNAYVTNTYDLDGDPRIVEAVVDMGAYEYQSIVPLAPTIEANYTNTATGYLVQFLAVVQGGAPTFISWDFGDGTVTTNQLLVSHAWNSTGAYSVTLTVSNAFTPGGATATATIFVVAPQVYVNLGNQNPEPPYTAWNTAATNIQNAIDASPPGSIILVSNGVYQVGGDLAADSTTNRIAIMKPLTVESVNGPQVTVIQGYQGPGGTNGPSAIRGAYVTNGAALIGFTLQGGGTSENTYGGGGVYCSSTQCLVSNCVITGNLADNGGGGVYQGTLNNCFIFNNTVLPTPYFSSYAYGGGVYGSTLLDCTIVSNSVPGFSYGGGAYNSTLTNCVVADNSSGHYGGGAYNSTLVNCDITGNEAFWGGGSYGGTLANCINYFNQASYAYTNYAGGSLSNCCTIPLPSGPGNITNAPILASLSQISANSPCRGSGSLAVTSGTDINGNPWANPPSIGCDEPYPGSMFGNVNVNISVPYTNYAPGYAAPFQVNITGPIYNSVWNFGDGAIVSNTPYTSHTWPAPGTYLVTLTAYNDSYPTGITATLEMTIAVPINYYVNVNNPNPIAPYSHWGTAATNIQAAVNVANAGNLILVSNGVYNTGGAKSPDGAQSRVTVTQPLILQSVNGPAVTSINGSTGYRCVYLTNGVTLNGFTLANGSTTNGGGIYAASTNALITNCVIAYCTANNYGNGGGTYSGTFYNCSILSNSSAGGDGGGAFGGAFDNCTIANNSATDGGGVYSGPGYPVTIENCTVVSNSVSWAGGGVYNVPSYDSAPRFNCLTNCVLTNCVISYNSASAYGSATFEAYLDNCTVISNKIAYEAVNAGYSVGCTLIGNQGAAAEPGDIDALGYSTSDVLSNCTLIANGEGAYDCDLYSCTLITNGEGAYDCYLYSCTLLQNQAGGALYSTLFNCLISSNTADGDGGGAYYCALTGCTLSFNQVANGYYGGGAYQSTLTSCSLVSNQATDGGGAYLSTLANCVLASNVATNGGGAYLSRLINCTVTANTAVLGGGTFDCTNYNSILYYNIGGDFYPGTKQYPLNYCCASLPATNGIRNITAPPLFVNPAGGDFHLQSSSPCINSGNNAYVTAPTDLEGNPRIVGGTVDIGAYEYQTPTSVISYAYLQQYGLPTDGSVDFADLDGTAFDVYQDWIAGLNPTNSASVLAMLTPITTNTATGVTVTWQSVNGIPYFLQRSTNLATQPPFSTIQNNITGQSNTTSYIDTSATNGVPYFYRVGVVAP